MSSDNQNFNFSVFTEETLKLLRKHSIADFSEDNSEFENVWEGIFGNANKLAMQFAFEYTLVHYGTYEKFKGVKDKIFDMPKLQAIAIQADRVSTHLEVLRNSGFTKHAEFKKIENNLINTLTGLKNELSNISIKINWVSM